MKPVLKKVCEIIWSRERCDDDVRDDDGDDGDDVNVYRR